RASPRRPGRLAEAGPLGRLSTGWLAFLCITTPVIHAPIRACSRGRNVAEPRPSGEETRGEVKEWLARPKGFEPLTPRFVVWCSIQLSYGRVWRARTYWGGLAKARTTRCPSRQSRDGAPLRVKSHSSTGGYGGISVQAALWS